MTEITCERCGRCCYMEVNGEMKKCRYLVLIGNKSSCRIYNNRLGTKLGYKDKNGNDYVCVERIKLKRVIEGCPYERLKENGKKKN